MTSKIMKKLAVVLMSAAALTGCNWERAVEFPARNGSDEEREILENWQKRDTPHFAAMGFQVKHYIYHMRSFNIRALTGRTCYALVEKATGDKYEGCMRHDRKPSELMWTKKV